MWARFCWCFQQWKVVTISAFPSFSFLALLLLHNLRLYLDLIAPLLSSLMTASRADRQIYLHWWRNGRREEVISRGPSTQPHRLGKEEQTLSMWLLPIQGISLSVLSLGLSVLSWLGPKLEQTQSPTSASQGTESRRQGLQPALTLAPDRFHKASDLFSLHHFSTRTLDEAGCCISSSSRADREGQSSHRKSND